MYYDLRKWSKNKETEKTKRTDTRAACRQTEYQYKQFRKAGKRSSGVIY